MTDRQIPFSAPMVRALLEGRKTQTRRNLPAAHPRFPEFSHMRTDVLDDPAFVWFWNGKHDGVGASHRIPYTTGDRLYVREAWRAPLHVDDQPPREIPPTNSVHYCADGDAPTIFGRYRHARFMPRWASRLTLNVTDVRVQRLREITAADSIAEGVKCDTCSAMGESACHGRGCFASQEAFRTLWNSLHGPDAWDENPWVVALTFTVARGNIDTLGATNA
ncbi:hypothetical protein IQ03_03645 [Gemmobacter caeni]|uniref:Uncharacterized protein n=1 Tax=Gemmobacter caeni TaxID=589035 RepID=A0A2T6ART4_9RHOB|nr:hypothetical protein [Gemmobacter caeni]PTX46534.1 hypothetical protein C8N34_11610 [Gemmobacter caeni]TWI95383.1 hypothetical protein IQ03_03645 [Gemmobacter caeni]